MDRFSKVGESKDSGEAFWKIKALIEKKSRGGMAMTRNEIIDALRDLLKRLEQGEYGDDMSWDMDSRMMLAEDLYKARNVPLELKELCRGRVW